MHGEVFVGGVQLQAVIPLGVDPQVGADPVAFLRLRSGHGGPTLGLGLGGDFLGLLLFHCLEVIADDFLHVVLGQARCAGRQGRGGTGRARLQLFQGFHQVLILLFQPLHAGLQVLRGRFLGADGPGITQGQTQDDPEGDFPTIHGRDSFLVV